MPISVRIGVTVATLVLLSIFGNVYAISSIIWSWPLPSGLSVDTGTLVPDRTFVMSDGVIAIGSAPCPQKPWLCTNTAIYPSTQAFWALDANTGKVKWTIPLPNGSVIRPVAGNQKLMIAEYSGNDHQGTASWKTLALDAQTGHIVWGIPRPNWSGDPLLAGNIVVTPDEMNPGNWMNPDPTLTAYDSSSGNLLWRIHTAPIESAPVAYGSGMIFAPGGQVGSYKGNMLTAYDASSGAMKWNREGLLSEGGACPTYMSGIVFVKQALQSQASVETVNLIALNALSGQTVWNKTIGYSWAGSGTPESSVLFPCPMISDGRLFVLSDKAPYQVLPNLVALNPADGRELWRHTFPCEQDPLNISACRQEAWNHQALSNSTLFMSAGFLYGIDTTTGTTTWTDGVTADNWNPLAYVAGVLYALNTPNGFSPVLSAFAISISPIPEMPTGTAVWILGVVLLGAQLFVMRNLRVSDKKRKSSTDKHW